MVFLMTNQTFKRESHAVARNLHDAAAVLFGLRFADKFTTSLRVAKLRKPCFRPPNILA